MKNLLPWFLLYSAAAMSSAAGFILPSPTTIRRLDVATGEKERQRLTVRMWKMDKEINRRQWMQKLTGHASALAMWFAGTKRSVPASLPTNSALLDPTVLTLTKGARTIHIVGTAHISSVSADLAGRLVRETAPDAVFVELDAARITKAFKGGIPPSGVVIAIQDNAGNLKVGVTEKPGFGKRLLIQFINSLSNPATYKKLERVGISVGQEFVNAVKAGIDTNSLIILGDQRLDVTYKRLSNALARADKRKLEKLDVELSKIVKEELPDIETWEQQGWIPRSQVRQYVSQYVESIKTVDTTKKMMDAFKNEVPAVWKAMVGERDLVMARNLNALPSQLQTVVAVMGLGHLSGVQQSLQSQGWKVLSLQK